MTNRFHAAAAKFGSLVCCVLTLMLVGCGSSPSAPSVLQVAGTWRGTSTLTAATGGECYGDGILPFIGGSFDLQMDLAQSGDRVTWATNTCSWSGTATSDGFTLSLSGGSCTDLQRFICGNGAVRESKRVASTMTFTVSGNRATGARTESMNVFLPGTSTVVGTLVTTESINVSR